MASQNNNSRHTPSTQGQSTKANEAGKKRRNRILIISAACGLAAVLLCAVIIVFLNWNSQGGENSDNPSEQTQSSDGAASEKSTKPESEPSSEKEEDKTKPTSSADKQTEGSFYSGVAYRSPVAKTADIFKHGRNLMLINKEWELPEDFKWDLVYWSNGQAADAMALNSQKHDSTKAVDRAAYEPLKKMFADAQKAGCPLELVSAYRSIDLQDRLFTRSVNSYLNQGYSKENAVKKANTERTFTGTSEHNVGLGFDILQKGNFTLSTSFESSEQFRWLRENAENYGFILRYRKDKTDETGIMYEPWHYRYVGVEHAKKINGLDMCLEEYIEYIER